VVTPTAVVFDIGGVLLDYDPRHLYRSLIADDVEREWFLAEVCTTEFNLALDAGRPFDEACEELAAQFPDHAELVHAWKRQDEMIAGEVPGVADLARRLRAAGVPLSLLTTMPADVFRSRLQTFEVLRGFDGAVVSGEEGVLKPSAELFEVLVKRFDLVPAETLFIDDSAVNVDGARAFGLQAHHFVDAATLEAALAPLLGD
jgi:2-haloacid dehalogenase